MILRKYGDDLETGQLVHIHWPTYRSLEEKLNLKDNEAASKLLRAAKETSWQLAPGLWVGLALDPERLAPAWQVAS